MCWCLLNICREKESWWRYVPATTTKGFKHNGTIMEVQKNRSKQHRSINSMKHEGVGERLLSSRAASLFSSLPGLEATEWKWPAEISTVAVSCWWCRSFTELPLFCEKPPEVFKKVAKKIIQSFTAVDNEGWTTLHELKLIQEGKERVKGEVKETEEVLFYSGYKDCH